MYIYFGSHEQIWQFASLHIQFCYREPQIFSRVSPALENAFGNQSLFLFLSKFKKETRDQFPDLFFLSISLSHT